MFFLSRRVVGVCDIRQVAAGLNLTVAVTLDGIVFQMGETGANGKANWEGNKSPEQVQVCPSRASGSFVATYPSCIEN